MLTKAQKSVRDLVLSAGDGAYLTAHINPNDVKCMRLLTSDHRPLRNIRYGVFRKMAQSEYFVTAEGRIGKVYVPSDSLKETVVKEQARKEAKAAKKQGK